MSAYLERERLYGEARDKADELRDAVTRAYELGREHERDEQMTRRERELDAIASQIEECIGDADALSGLAARLLRGEP